MKTIVSLTAVLTLASVSFAAQGGKTYTGEIMDSACAATYQLSDQTKPAQFAGAKVTVTGTLNDATKTIAVADIKAAS